MRTVPEPQHYAHQLPAELLVVIFKLTAGSLQLSDYPHRDGQPWIHLSHVCQRWRTVALAFQELWSMNLPRASEHWTATCLSRAPSVLLDVVLEHPFMYRESGYHKAALTVISQWPRIKTLHASLACELVPDQSAIREVSQVIFDGLFDVLSVPNPDIEELTLSISTTVQENFWLPVHLPPSMCSSQHLPKLREVELENCNVPHSPTHGPPFSSCLRVLKLKNTRAWSDVDSAIECLQATPLLEVLECRYDYSRKGEKTGIQSSRIHQPRCISLPYLRDLILDGLWIQNVAIFKHIAAPSSCSFTLGSSPWDNDDVSDLSEGAFHTLVSTTRESLEQHFAPASSQGVTFNHVRLEEGELVASNTLNDRYPTSAGSLPLEITIIAPGPDDDAIRLSLFEACFSHLVFTQAFCLSFSEDVWDSCSQLYDAYTNVREIMFSRTGDLNTFTSALLEKGAALFPKLSHVIVERYQNDHADRSTDLISLVRALCSVYSASEQFESLIIPDGILSKDILDDVREMIGPNRLSVCSS